MCVYPCAEIMPPHMSIYRYTAISHNTLLPRHSPPLTRYCIHAHIPPLLIQASVTALAFSMEGWEGEHCLPTSYQSRKSQDGDSPQTLSSSQAEEMHFLIPLSLFP